MYDRMCLRYWPGLIPSSDHFELVLLKFALAGGFAVGVAYLSRKYFEERFLQLKNRLAPHPHAEQSLSVTPQIRPLPALFASR
jgi:hypothetical protein